MNHLRAGWNGDLQNDRARQAEAEGKTELTEEI